MGFGAGEMLHSMLTIKIKPRHDSVTDQILRIVVVKIFVLASIMMGFGWFLSEIHCIPPPSTTFPKKSFTACVGYEASTCTRD